MGLGLLGFAGATAKGFLEGTEMNRRNARQDNEDAYTAKLRARQDEAFAREESARAGQKSYMEKLFSEDPDTPRPLDQGYTPEQPEGGAEAGLLQTDAPSEGSADGVTQYTLAPPGSPPGAAPANKPKALAFGGMNTVAQADNRLKSLRNRMEYAKSQGNVDMFQKAMDEARQVRGEMESVQIGQAVLNDTPDGYVKRLEAITNSQGSGLEMRFDPKTSSTLVKYGQTEVPMSRLQVSKVMMAMNKIKNGSAAGFTELEGIHSGFAAAAKAQQAEIEKRRAEQNKTEKLGPNDSLVNPITGKVVYQGQPRLKAGETEVIHPDGTRTVERVDGKVHPIIKASFGESEGAMVAPATSLFQSLMSKNKIPEAQAAKMAVQFTRGDYSNVVEEFDMDTGLNRRLYVDRDQKDAKGAVTSIGSGKKYLVSEDEYGEGERFTPAQAQAAVAQMQAKLPADVFARYAATATPAGEKLFQDQYKGAVTALVAQAKKDLAAATTPEQQAAIKQAYVAQQEKMLAEARRADLVRQFYKPPMPKPAATATKPAQGVLPGSLAAPQMATAKPGVSPVDMGDDFQSPSAKAALAQRVDQASRGGPPVTRVERLRAQQTGLMR